MRSAQFAAAVATRCEAFLGQIRSDSALKEELVRQVEMSQQEYLFMRQKYEERLKLIQDGLTQAHRERDQALKSIPATRGIDGDEKTRTKYEEKIKRLGKELNELRERMSEVQRQSNSKTSANEMLVRNLRATLQVAQREKTRLAGKLNDETTRLRTDCFSHDAEIKDLRGRERKAMEQARKWKKAYDFQKAMLQKRIEQYLVAKGKIRVLLNALRKRHVSLASPSLGINLESPGWRRLQGNVSPLLHRSSISRHVDGTEEPQEQEREREQERYDGEHPSSISNSMMEDDPDEIMYEDTDEGRKESSPFVQRLYQNKKSLTGQQQPNGLYTASPLRRSSLNHSHTGEAVMPRSLIKQSPLIPRRKDFFARLADAASLSLAVQQQQQQTQNHAQTEKPS